MDTKEVLKRLKAERKAYKKFCLPSRHIRPYGVVQGMTLCIVSIEKWLLAEEEQEAASRAQEEP